MLSFFIATALTVSPMMEEAVNRMCAARVGIPYGSDNFTDQEWQRFQLCRDIMHDALERDGRDV